MPGFVHNAVLWSGGRGINILWHKMSTISVCGNGSLKRQHWRITKMLILKLASLIVFNNVYKLLSMTLLLFHEHNNFAHSCYNTSRGYSCSRLLLSAISPGRPALPTSYKALQANQTSVGGIGHLQRCACVWSQSPAMRTVINNNNVKVHW